MSLIIEVLLVDISFKGDATTDRTKSVVVHRLVWIRQESVNGWLGIEGKCTQTQIRRQQRCFDGGMTEKK